MRFLTRVGLVLGLVIVIAVPSTSARPTARQKFFLSPSKNISCEIDDGGASGVPVDAFCETYTPARSVDMSAGGHLKRCTGTKCLGDPPETAFTLGYGHSVTLGPFTCLSETSGMRCTTSGGHGFTIARSGISSF